jgi:hypothetical protein
MMSLAKKIQPLILSYFLFIFFALPWSLPAQSDSNPSFSPADLKFLDLVEQKAFNFFWEQADPKTGLIKDQTDNWGEDTAPHKKYRASIASVGFGLSAYIVGVERGWVTKEQAYDRIKKTLVTFDTLLKRNDKGLYWHWIDMRNNGQWFWDDKNGSEFSTIDTGLFLTGAISAAEYFNSKYGDPEFKNIVDRIYSSIKWNSLNDGTMLSYNEYIILNLLGFGSPDNTLSRGIWQRMGRDFKYSTVNRKGESKYPRIFYPSLFIHLFPEAWFDFRDKHDKYADYFISSRNSVLANRQYCIDHAKGGIADPKFQFATYNENSWGLSASEVAPPKGYDAYGEPDPLGDDYAGAIPGTVAIHAAGGSMPYTPVESFAMMKYLYATYKNDLWGKYGFCDSFNTDPSQKAQFNNKAKTMWRADIVSGLDQGITLLMIENYRTGLIWKYFMMNQYVQKGMERAGFVKKEKIPAGAMLDLSGKWAFNTGDDMKWKEPGFNDSSWKQIAVPGKWEDQGFPDYDGLAWYRTGFKAPAELTGIRGQLVLILGACDDADETYLNGQKIGGMGDFPPNKESAWNVTRTYEVPKDLLKKDGLNVLAVRVNDNTAGGGIWRGPVMLAPLDAVNYNPLRINFASGNKMPVAKIEASSTQSKDLPENAPKMGPENMLDDKPETRWSSEFQDNQWVMLSLNKISTPSKLVINWEAACAQSYKVLVSTDKVKWEEIFATDDGPGGLDEIDLGKRKAKYIKIDLLKRATEWGFSILDVQVFE